jgi:hypothetical protein
MLNWKSLGADGTSKLEAILNQWGAIFLNTEMSLIMLRSD